MSELLATLPVIVAFVIAGLLWSTSGIIKNYRKHIVFVNANPAGTKDPNWSGVDKEAIKSDVILGTALGIVAFFANAYNGQITVDASTPQLFTAIIIGAYGLVALVDNLIISK